MKSTWYKLYNYGKTKYLEKIELNEEVKLTMVDFNNKGLSDW